MQKMKQRIYRIISNEDILYDFTEHSPEMLELLHCASGNEEFPNEMENKTFEEFKDPNLPHKSPLEIV